MEWLYSSSARILSWARLGFAGFWPIPPSLFPLVYIHVVHAYEFLFVQLCGLKFALATAFLDVFFIFEGSEPTLLTPGNRALVPNRWGGGAANFLMVSCSFLFSVYDLRFFSVIFFWWRSFQWWTFSSQRLPFWDAPLIESLPPSSDGIAWFISNNGRSWFVCSLWTQVLQQEGVMNYKFVRMQIQLLTIRLLQSSNTLQAFAAENAGHAGNPFLIDLSWPILPFRRILRVDTISGSPSKFVRFQACLLLKQSQERILLPSHASH